MSASANATISCPACRAANSDGSRFCSQCAAALGVVTETSAAPAERKQVTVLFSDLTGFTALTEHLDPEETREIMNRVFGRAAEVIARYEGRIEKFVGDAIMAIFGVPTAHEDDPVRAVRAAFELHEAVAALSPGVEAHTGTPIALHTGINTGLVVTGELQFDGATAGPLGDTINLAARLMSAAPTGEIWIGPETRGLVSRLFELEDLGTHEFKGKARSIPVARVLGAVSRSVTAIQFRGAFIGRQAELGTLLGAAESMRDGAPSVFGICGDAGTGKSRLVAEFRAKVGDDVQWLEGRAYPYAQSIPYAPVIDLLSRSWAIEESDSPSTVRAKLSAGVADLLRAPSAVLPLFLHLYNLPQDEGMVIEREAFQERLLNAIKQLLAALVERAPTVLCLQDLHWADSSTALFLRGLSADLNVPVLLLGNYRPGFIPPPAMTVLALSELSPRQTAELLGSLLKGQPPEALLRFIEERSDGNPFYVEEVVNALAETEVLVRDSQGWRLSRPLSEVGVPATVVGVIAARIDRLSEARRRVLRDAAVVGREFLYAIIARVTQQTDELAPILKALQAADLIRTRRPEPELEYIFKHALTQEVAYDGLLKIDRRQLHARAAYAMEVVFADRIGEFVETLAYHFLRGGITDKAVYYLAEAGRKCVARYALREATVHFQDAYSLISDLPDSAEQSRSFAELLVAWSHVHYYDGTIGQWCRLLEKHLADAERCDDPAVAAMYFGWLGNVRNLHGDERGALESIERALKVGRAAGARSAVAHTLAWHGFSLLILGRVDDAIRAFESVEQTVQEVLVDPYPHFKSQFGLVRALAYKGDLLGAHQLAARLVAVGRHSGSTRAECMAHAGVSLIWLLALDFDRAQDAGQSGISAATDPHFAAWNAVFRAIPLLADMQFDAAAKLADEYLPHLLQNENFAFERALRAVRAMVDLSSGQLSNGFRGTLAIIQEARDRGWQELVFFNEVFLILTYVSIARMDVRPSLGAILRNPWFVFTQAPFAARRARALIDRMRTEAKAKGMTGFFGLIDLGEARLLAHQGRKMQADKVIDRIRCRLAEAGVEHIPAPVAALMAEVAALPR